MVGFLQKARLVIISTCISFGASLLIFRDLWPSLSTHLLDWSDYPLVIALNQQNLYNWAHLPLHQWFFTFMFAPHMHGMLFADPFWPPAVITGFFTLFSSNLLTTFNLTFATTLLLNSVASSLFWYRWRSTPWLHAAATLVNALSPFFFSQLGHFQMIEFWPFLFSWFLIWHVPHRYKWFGVGFFWFIQFTASVYLAIFFLTALLWWWATLVMQSIKTKTFILVTRQIILQEAIPFLLVGGLLISPLAYLYKLEQRMQGVVRDQGEMVLYAAHASDYLWNRPLFSEAQQWPFFRRWHALNKHAVGEAAVFPGIILTLLFFIALWQMSKNKKWNQEAIFFLGLFLIGFIFSLGPRCNWNGTYCVTPLPYYVFAKLFPLAGAIRATARWSFLVYISMSYFAIWQLSRTPKKWQGAIATTCILVYLFEVVPMKLPITSQPYENSITKYLQSVCAEQPKLVLEYPFPSYTPIVERSLPAMQTLIHRCRTVNGYSGYEPKGFHEINAAFADAIIRSDSSRFRQLFNDNKIEYLLVVPKRFSDPQFSFWIDSQWFLTERASDSGQMLYAVTSP